MVEDTQTVFDKVKADMEGGNSDEELFQFLEPLLRKDSQSAGKVAELLATLPDVKVVKILHRMLEASNEKKVRKIIKRSLYRLKGKGVTLEEFPVEKGRSILHPLHAEPPKGFGSSIDFLGHRLLVLVIPHAGRGWTVMQGVVSDTQGFIDFSGSEMTRKEFKEFFEDMNGESPFPLVEIEPSYVGFLFTQAYQLTLQTKGIPPQDFFHLKKEVESVKKEFEKPLIYSYLETDEIAGNDRILMRAGDLLKADLFSGWMIEESQIQPYADAVWEAEGSKIVLTQVQKEARFQEIYQRAMFELFPAEKRSLYDQRLEEMAYILFKLGRQEEARTSLCAAIDLKKPLNPIQPNPFLLQLVIKSIFAILAEAYEKMKKEPSFIVKP